MKTKPKDCAIVNDNVVPISFNLDCAILFCFSLFLLYSMFYYRFDVVFLGVFMIVRCKHLLKSFFL